MAPPVNGDEGSMASTATGRWAARAAVTSADTSVNWIPLYHDMGLIGAWLGSLYYAMPLVLMSPLAFLARPQRWLQAIHKYRGTLSAAPNFAYELCLNKVSAQELDAGNHRCRLDSARQIVLVADGEQDRHRLRC